MQEFYKKILPSKGYFAVAVISAGKIKHEYTDEVGSLITYVDKFKEKGNLYFTPVSFNSARRLAKETLLAKSFFIDLDVGDDPKKYPDQRSALEALENFCAEGFPAPIIVNSGTGIQAYWPLTQELDYNTWKTYAERFKKYCIKQGLKIDHAVTADAARLMRCPDTWNLKTDPPSPTNIIFLDSDPVEFEFFKELFGEDLSISSILQSIPKGLDEDTAAVNKSSFENFEYSFENIVLRTAAGQGCQQIGFILEHRATLSEPLWHTGLSIAEHCVDRETAIHLISEGHPGYDPDLTERKAKATHGKPQGCKEFETRNIGGCTGCSHRGRITTPIVLGKKLREEREVLSEQTSTSVANGTVQTLALPLVNLPKELYPYTRGPNGGIYYVAPPEEDGEGNMIPQPLLEISKYDIYPVKRIFHRVEGECLEMRYSLPLDGTREFNVPVAIIQSQEELIKAVGKYGVSFVGKDRRQHFMNYIIEWNQYLQKQNSAEQMRMQMGWTEDLDGFVVGQTEIRRDGSTIKAAASPLVISIARLLHTEGRYDLWQRAANKLDMRGFEIHAFVMLCGFGAPLMRFTSTAGIMVSVVGPTGYGKTGALYGALSLFAEPKGISIAGGKDLATGNALIGWYLGLKNILLGLDESSNRKPEELSNLSHQMAQGKGKLRMQASQDAVRDLALTASTICVMTNNQSVVDRLEQFKFSPDGEMARLVELWLTKPAFMDKEMGTEIFDTFRTNYGFAGPLFIKALFKLGEDGVREKIKKYAAKFGDAYSNDSSYRFYENLIGATFAAGEIAIEAGILDWNLNRIFDIVLSNMLGVKDRSPLAQVDFENILGEFQNKYLQNTLFIDKNGVVQEPRLNIVCRMELHKDMLYVSVKEFNDYLRNLQISIRELTSDLTSKGILEWRGKQRLTAGWPGHSDVSPVTVYGFRVTGKEPKP